MNFFQYSGDFYSFAAGCHRPYCFPDETIRDPDVAESFNRLERKP
jgi:hypothetical protein